MVIGSVLTPFSATVQLEIALSDAIAATHTGGELKWEKVRNHNLKIYKAFVIRLLDEIEGGRAWLNAIVLNREQLRHQRFNAGDAELGFSKFVYKHLLKYVRLEPEGHFYAFLDRRVTRHDVSEFRGILNAGAFRKCGAVQPYRLVQFKDSSESRIIQAVDILIGSIAYVLNGHGSRPEAAPAKRAMAELIQSRKPLVPSFNYSTPPWKKNVNIWHFRLSE
jgi:hypothetical protein